MYNSLNLQDQNPYEPTLVVYFNSECDHCEREVKDFGENLNKFSGIKLVFVSSEPSDQAISFLSKYNLNKFHVETDTEDIINTFIGGVPQVFVYFDGKLDQHFVGETSVDVIIESLNQ